MKLKDCTFGMLVTAEGLGIGMIVGITNRCQHADHTKRSDPDNAIPLVRWASGQEFGIDAFNIEMLK